MKPTYESECGRVRLYLGDCLHIAPTLQGVDALVSDPPYGISLPSNYAATRRNAEAKDKRRHAWPCREHAPQIIGDDKPFDPSPWLHHKTILLWGAQNYASKLPDKYSWLAWDKRDARGANSHQGDAELCWCSGVPFNSVRMFHHLWIGYQRDSEVGEKVLHPTQKPVAVMAWAMDQAKIKEGATVLDPYMGSGSTIIAAIRTGRKAIGIEKDPAHYATACDRIKRELAQGDLFLGNAAKSNA